MKAHPVLFFLVFLVAAQAFGAAPSAADKQREMELKKRHDTHNNYADVYSARKAGNWDSDIWLLRKTLESPDFSPAPKGKRPGKMDNADLRRAVTLSSTAEVFRLFNNAHRASFVIAKGGKLAAKHFYGYNGTASATVELQNGGELLIENFFFVAGSMPECTGKGEFLQNGGTVSAKCSLYLAGPWTQTSSPKCTGVYTLAGGVLNINSPKEKEGISKGVGNGIFYFGKGTLNTRAVAINLENINGGNLSPGGDAQVGETVLNTDTTAKNHPGSVYDEARTYTQGKNSRLTINLASKSQYDRLIWTTPQRKGSVVLKSGTVIWIENLKKYTPSSGAKFDIILADHLSVEGELSLEGPDARNFSYEVVDGKTLRLTYGK